MNITDLPKVGSLRWHAWRKSGIPVEQWLREERFAQNEDPPQAPAPQEGPPPALQPTIEAAKVSPQPEAASVDPGASQEGRVTQAPDPWEGFDPGAPVPINPAADPNDTTRSYPSGGPLLERPIDFLEERLYSGNTGQRKARPGRKRRDTDDDADAWGTTSFPGMT